MLRSTQIIGNFLAAVLESSRITDKLTMNIFEAPIKYTRTLMEISSIKFISSILVEETLRFRCIPNSFTTETKLASLLSISDYNENHSFFKRNMSKVSDLIKTSQRPIKKTLSFVFKFASNPNYLLKFPAAPPIIFHKNILAT